MGDFNLKSTNMQRHVIIYHNKDLDGFCSGAIIYEALKLQGIQEVDLMGYDYGDPYPYIANSHIYMADVSFPMDAMVYLSLQNKSFTWIDHHKTAIDAFNALSESDKSRFETVLDTSLSACELCWKWASTKEIPEAVKLLGEYDTWRGYGTERWNNLVYPFQFGMRQLVKSAENFPFHLFEASVYDNPNKPYIDDVIDAIVDNGQKVVNYIEAQNAKLMANAHPEVMNFGLDKYIVVAINQAGLNSEAFKSVWNPNEHDLMIPYWFDGRKWCYSLYTTHKHINCGELAKLMGGGGHKGAAGFKRETPLVF